MSVYAFILCLCCPVCTGRGLASGQSSVQGVLRTEAERAAKVTQCPVELIIIMKYK